ncbi:cytochrome C [Bacteroidetes bacterium UKL13-3]|jgi:thiosulfate dehydrogenase|nr:cytochrome C [Bacteroidetes bacterium UKL13-3]HCP92619.1 cytochrome C [Bacteroidota bacterium]
MKLYKLLVFTLILIFVLNVFLVIVETVSKNKNNTILEAAIAEHKADALHKEELWQKPDETTIPKGEEGELVKYGKELIMNTAMYLGPKGSVLQISNGMNCQNCHLEAGSKPWGNNYSAVYSTYPKFRERSGATETISKRVNDCFERSLNGKALDTTSKEMLAITSYIKWLGYGVKQGEKPKGSGIMELPFLERPAYAKKGLVVYQEKCQSCHQQDGGGMLNSEKTAYTYPPLWGKHSYNNGAGLFRLTRFAGYVKANMPLGASHTNTVLTDEQAWDVAAFVNSQPRPQKDLSKDWPNIASKPIDHPFGPFADGFSEAQHKYGPFKPIKDKKDSLKKKSI